MAFFSCITLNNSWYRRRLCKLFSSTALPDIDLNYYCDSNNATEIKSNIELRKGVGNIERVLEMYKLFKEAKHSDESYQTKKEELYRELVKLPNRTHPAVHKYQENPCLLHELNKKRDFGAHAPLEFSEITRRLNLMRTDKLGHTCGHKSYYFLGELAELEEALIKYTVSMLLKERFQLVAVPDILPSYVLESCGMTVKRDRTQIYSLDPVHHGPDLYLSGTAEMSLAGLLMNSVHSEQSLPLKLAAVSRCFRAETSNMIEERGIYRVHQFTKVEMFVVATPEQSDAMLDYIRNIQEQLFTPLEIHMRVLDMPPHELGAPAYRKYDIEAWMPGRDSYGEISSCSNCTDYQSRRLHILLNNDKGNKRYTHTLNGTACAIPRMLIALLETHQDPKGKIHIPKKLQPFMNGREFITRNIIGEECNNNEGVCELFSKCDIAKRQYYDYGKHKLSRCGFSDKEEIVCCPNPSDRRGSEDADHKPQVTPAHGSKPHSRMRIADMECERIRNTTTPGLTNYIIGGTEAQLGDFPHMAALGYETDNSRLYKFNCGGSLISDRYVVTAAHCVFNRERVTPSMVRMGVVELCPNGAEECAYNASTDARIAETIIHPNYTKSTKYDDIALLRLEPPVQYKSDAAAAPVCLYTSTKPPGPHLIATGFGQFDTSSTKKSNVLLQASLTYVTQRDCQQSLPERAKLRMPEGIKQTQLCAVDPVRDTCNGDSGGPLVTMVATDSYFRLAALTSGGGSCGSGRPAIYTALNQYLDWIEPLVWPQHAL